MNAHSRRRVTFGVVCLLPVFVACSEDLPTEPRNSDPDALTTALASVIAIPCTADLAAQTVSCERVTVPAALKVAGFNADVITGQHINVTLTSSNVSFNSGTGVFQMDVTVQNLMNESIGTPDGTQPDPEGIQVFLGRQPQVTSGTGSVSTLNHDGIGTFTRTGQPFWTYSQVLAKNEVSSAKNWQFQVDPSVGTFSFMAYLETDRDYLLVINEFLANPGGTILDASGEWVEIYNAGNMPVELMNLVIADSAPSGRRPYHLISLPLTIQPGGYIVIGNTTNTTNNGGVPVDYAYGAAMAFTNSLDAFKISRVVGTDTLTLDRTQYASAAISAQNGISRELRNPALDNANMDGSNWSDALVTAVYGPGGRGTPKAQNSTYTP